MRKTIILLTISGIAATCYCQLDPKISFPQLAMENLEYKALKSTFYLVVQEYTLFSPDGNQVIRGNKNFFGRTFAIGVLSQDNKLWFPKYVRFPWKQDQNFNEYKKTHTPKCTIFRIRMLDDTTYKDYNINKFPVDTSDLALWIYSGIYGGIPFTDELIKHGTLITFYASSPVPEKKGDITYSVSSLSNLEWDSNGICRIEEIKTLDQQIMGGALYQRLITPGKIEWKLAGFYVPVDNTWIIQSIKNLL